MTFLKILKILAILIGVLLLGTAGYQAVQPNYTFLDSLYMTVITVTTIGYKEVKPLTDAGRVFNIILILVGWFGFFMVARIGGQMIIEGQLIKILGRHRMDKKLASLSDHYIVCGYGRVGMVVCDELHRNKIRFAVIERNPELIEELIARKFIYHEGDCTSDDSLLAAGIKKARGLINAVADEADAVYITLSARSHNPDIFIMARADSTAAEQKLKRAGADRVISPHVSAGSRMAMAAIRPNVVDFMSIEQGDGLVIRIEEVEVSEGSKLVGKSLKEMEVRARYGLNIIGMKKNDGRMIYNPSADQIINGSDTLFMVGDIKQLSKIDELLAPSE
ncbi:MAG: potassium channel protein [Candidatus Zixiibacteriota bacterium]|nr:MAG: potassium channel protein [candidate division Zixibacteria bacterium]